MLSDILKFSPSQPSLLFEESKSELKNFLTEEYPKLLNHQIKEKIKVSKIEDVKTSNNDVSDSGALSGNSEANSNVDGVLDNPEINNPDFVPGVSRETNYDVVEESPGSSVYLWLIITGIFAIFLIYVIVCFIK